MTRVLYWGDSPLVGTGYGRLAAAILPELARAGHRVRAIGMSASPHDPRVSNVGGVELLSVPASARGHADAFELLSRDADVVFAICDPSSAPPRELVGNRRSILYTGTDWPCSRSVGTEIEAWDIVVAANRYGRSCIEQGARPRRLEVIPHGMDLATFRPGPSSARERLGIGVEDVLLVNVAQNTRKKNLPALLDAFATFRRELEQQKRRAVLYLHTAAVDAAPPWGVRIDLLACAAACGLVVGRDVLFPKSAPPHGPGNSPAELAELLRAADAFVSSSLSEGWCLPMTEAMACGVPVVVPYHTAFEELTGGGERGYLCACAGRNWIPELDAHRPHISPSAIAAGLLAWWNDRRDDPELLAAMIDSARAFTDGLDWSRVLPEWLTQFRRLAP